MLAAVVISVVFVLFNGHFCNGLLAAKKTAPKRPATWEYTADQGKGWDDWGKDLAASNVIAGKRPRKGVNRME